MKHEDELVHQGAGPTHMLERLIFFSDAVFAIAITLLVIDLKIPDVPRHSPDVAYINGLLMLIPNFLGFFISFFVIGAFWAAHYRALSCAQHWHASLMFPNLTMLCAIAAMPFFTAFNSANWNDRVPVMTYCGWLLLTALLNVRLQRIATSPPVVAKTVSAETIAGIRVRGVATVLGASTGLVVGYFVPSIGTTTLISIPVWRALLNARRARAQRLQPSG